MKRPLVWVFGALLAVFVLAGIFYGDLMEEAHYPLDDMIEDSPEDFQEAAVTGTLDSIETKPNSKFLYLKNSSVTLPLHGNTYSFEHLLVITMDDFRFELLPGNVLTVSGELQKLEVPTNLGQFDEKAYYREKNIYYKVFASKLQMQNPKTDLVKACLFRLQQKIFAVYQQCLSSEDAGVVSAMLLGEKSALEADIREQYQKNGIGHILAISGLHISILCLVLFQGLSRLSLPKPIPFLVTLFFLLLYGVMTGFGISVSRAICMMLLQLFSKEIGRSYDALTAMAVSAFIILLQKPYAVFSCGFLLSYSAVFGAVYLYPVLNGILFGSLTEQRKRRRRQQRKQKEATANSPCPTLYSLFYTVMQKLFSSLLCSTAIWITTFPVLLYFYYEIPAYSILLNLIILPLLSTVVVFSFLAGIAGLFCLPLAQYLLCPVHWILEFYQAVCNFFEKLPGSVQVFGCPAVWKIVLYYVIVLAIMLFFQKRILYSEQLKVTQKIMAGAFFVLSCLLMVHKPPVKGLQVTMLDVGQGDGIFLQSEEGISILIDGGSTDTKEVGKYRIIPYLKYHGIRTIDYMIMTHADEDHVSGQLELLESTPGLGIAIDRYLMPVPDKSCIDEHYTCLLKAAEKAQIPVSTIQAGDRISSGKLSLLCLHPEKGYLAESANAYSTTLSLTYGKNSMLLTGDLEGDGEEMLLEKVQQKKFLLPQKYNILKVAHHGSKNSTSEEYLSAFSPAISLISCGRDNRYGHPHKELLERLQAIHTKVYQTAECGSVLLQTDGTTWTVKPYLSKYLHDK